MRVDHQLGMMGRSSPLARPARHLPKALRAGILILSIGIGAGLLACTQVQGKDISHIEPITASPAIQGPSPSAKADFPISPTLKPQSHTPRPTSTATPRPTVTPRPPLIVIDPGHGGRDLGARHFDSNGHMDFYESQVNLDLALKVRDRLSARGFRVLLTRTGDYALNDPPEDVNGDGEINYLDEAQARVDLINDSGADLLLSIHQNAYYDDDEDVQASVGGTLVLYCADRPFASQSLRFGELVREALVQAFHDLGHEVYDRGVQDDLLLITPDSPGKHIILLGPQSERIVRPCQVPGILSETLFITHPIEAKLARDPAALDRLADAYAQAVESYFRGEATAP